MSITLLVRSLAVTECYQANLLAASRAWTLYAYSDPSRPEDLSVDENVLVKTHRALDNEDWIYATVESSSKSGWLPANYVAPITYCRFLAPGTDFD
jgi:hypothetical protein